MAKVKHDVKQFSLKLSDFFKNNNVFMMTNRKEDLFEKEKVNNERQKIIYKTNGDFNSPVNIIEDKEIISEFNSIANEIIYKRPSTGYREIFEDEEGNYYILTVVLHHKGYDIYIKRIIN